MISVRQVHHTQAVLKHRSLSKAAGAINVSQSALTKSIGKLESDLGIRLFERSKSGMKPTDYCLAIIDKFDAVAHTVDDIEFETRLYRNLQTGSLNVVCGNAVANSIFTRVLPVFVEKYPDVQVSLNAGTAEQSAEALKSRKIDYVIAGANSYRHIDGITIDPIARIPLAVFVRKSHPLAGVKDVQTSDILDLKLMVTQRQAIDALTHPLRQFAKCTQIACGSYLALKEIARRTDNAIAAPVSESELSEDEQFVQLEWKFEHLFVSLSTIRVTGRGLSPAAIAFRDLCIDAFAPFE